MEFYLYTAEVCPSISSLDEIFLPEGWKSNLDFDITMQYWSCLVWSCWVGLGPITYSISWMGLNGYLFAQQFDILNQSKWFLNTI